jgi:hypothetical protein
MRYQESPRGTHSHEGCVKALQHNPPQQRPNSSNSSTLPRSEVFATAFYKYQGEGQGLGCDWGWSSWIRGWRLTSSERASWSERDRQKRARMSRIHTTRWQCSCQAACVCSGSIVIGCVRLVPPSACVAHP